MPSTRFFTLFEVHSDIYSKLIFPRAYTIKNFENTYITYVSRSDISPLPQEKPYNTPYADKLLGSTGRQILT